MRVDVRVQRTFMSDRLRSCLSFLGIFHTPSPPLPLKIRVCWYQLMVSLQDEDTQKYGVVDVVYNIGLAKHDAQFADVIAKAHMLRDGVPFRLSALHYCYDNPLLRSAMSLVQIMVGRDYRLRFRTHFGRFAVK